MYFFIATKHDGQAKNSLYSSDYNNVEILWLFWLIYNFFYFNTLKLVHGDYLLGDNIRGEGD